MLRPAVVYCGALRCVGLPGVVLRVVVTYYWPLCPVVCVVCIAMSRCGVVGCCVLVSFVVPCRGCGVFRCFVSCVVALCRGVLFAVYYCFVCCGLLYFGVMGYVLLCGAVFYCGAMCCVMSCCVLLYAVMRCYVLL